MYGILQPEQPERPPMPVNNDPTPPMSMAPPPSAEFNSREELLDFQKDWAENQGFAVVIGRSRPNRLWIKCDRGGEYSDKHLHDPENRKRKRKATRLTGCPFNIKATMKKDKIWRCHTEVGEHNHGPSEDLSIHPSLRRMNDEQLAKVNQMTEAGNTPVETLDELQRLWPGIKVLRRDIYNARKKYKTEKELADFAQGANVPQPFEDPNGKIPGPTRTGRWEWLEDGDEVKRKKRKKSSVSGPPPAQATFPPPGPPPQQSNLAPELREHNPPPPAPTLAARRGTSGMNNAAQRRNYQQPPHPSPAPQQQLHQGARPQEPQPDFPRNINGPNRSPAGNFRQYAPPPGPPPPRHNYRTPSQSSASEPMHQQQSSGPPQGPPQGLPQGQPLRPRGVADTMPIGPMVSPINGNPTAAPPAPAPPAPATAANMGGPKHQSGHVLMSRIERMEKEQRDQKAMLSQILGAVTAGQGMNGLQH